MPHPTPYPLCIFCGAKANSREHAIPAWMAKRLRLKDAELVFDQRSTITSTRKQVIRFSSHRERIFCKGCNSHFKHLEDEVIPVMEWMAWGRPLALGDGERDVIARWGAKTGLALMAAEKELRASVPPEHAHYLRQNGHPHPDCWIGYATWQGRAFKAGNLQTFDLPGVDGTRHAYMDVFTFRNVALKLFGVLDSTPGFELGGPPPGFIQVWPDQGTTLHWPSSPVWHEDNIVAMTTFTPLRQIRQ